MFVGYMKFFRLNISICVYFVYCEINSSDRDKNLLKREHWWNEGSAEDERIEAKRKNKQDL